MKAMSDTQNLLAAATIAALRGEADHAMDLLAESRLSQHLAADGRFDPVGPMVFSHVDPATDLCVYVPAVRS